MTTWPDARAPVSSFPIHYSLPAAAQSHSLMSGMVVDKLMQSLTTVRASRSGRSIPGLQIDVAYFAVMHGRIKSCA